MKMGELKREMAYGGRRITCFQSTVLIRDLLSEVIESIENRPLMEAAPGFLTQADILSKIGAAQCSQRYVLVRAYGTASDGVEDARVTACCELVLQRTLSRFAGFGSRTRKYQLNRQFGRRFERVSFRWLEEDEI